MTVALIACLIIMAALGSFMYYCGFECMAIAFASYGGKAIGYFSLGSIDLLCGVALIALVGAIILLWIRDE